VRRSDAFAHILARAYRERLEHQLERPMSNAQLRHYREGVFGRAVFGGNAARLLSVR